MPPPMRSHHISIANPEVQYECQPDTNLLEGMTRLGLKGIPLGCRGGGCGICKVQIISGNYTRGVMSREHISEEDERCHHGLACRIYPQGDLEVKITGCLKKPFGLK
jgi:ferredoxin